MRLLLAAAIVGSIFGTLASRLYDTMHTPAAVRPVTEEEQSPIPPLVAVTDDGTEYPLPSWKTHPDNEDAWFWDAQNVARQLGQHVVVVQGERFVCLVRPPIKDNPNDTPIKVNGYTRP